MTDFTVLKVSERALFWFELASYASPFATVGSLILSGFSLASENRQERRLAEISKKLDQIKVSINQTRRALEQKLNNMPLRERTGEVLGIEEALNEFRILNSQGILDNIVSDSAQTKRKIETYINAPDTPVEYRVLYLSLYATLIPLRIAAFELFDRPINDINQLVKSETESLLDAESISITSIENVGSNRVSALIFDTFIWDELGPRYGSKYSVQIDNSLRELGLYTDGPESERTAIRESAEKRRDELANQKASEASEPFRLLFETSKVTLGTLS